MDLVICLYLILLQDRINEYLVLLDDLQEFLKRSGLHYEFESFMEIER
jgi:hypothetical protein